jgi:hypothetical protein
VKKWLAKVLLGVEDRMESIGILQAQIERSHAQILDLNGELIRTRKALAACREAMQPFAPVGCGDAPEWSTADAEGWRRFLSSEPGRKLQALANWQEQAANRTAILQKHQLENAAGFARGWHTATSFFFKSLSANVRPEQDTAKQQGDEANPLLERLAP